MCLVRDLCSKGAKADSLAKGLGRITLELDGGPEKIMMKTMNHRCTTSATTRDVSTSFSVHGRSLMRATRAASRRRATFW